MKASDQWATTVANEGKIAREHARQERQKNNKIMIEYYRFCRRWNSKIIKFLSNIGKNYYGTRLFFFRQYAVSTMKSNERLVRSYSEPIYNCARCWLLEMSPERYKLPVNDKRHQFKIDSISIGIRFDKCSMVPNGFSIGVHHVDGDLYVDAPPSDEGLSKVIVECFPPERHPKFQKRRKRSGSELRGGREPTLTEAVRDLAEAIRT